MTYLGHFLHMTYLGHLGCRIYYNDTMAQPMQTKLFEIKFRQR